MEQKHIYLIGFMGAGKSTVAKALAKKTGLPVMEMDDIIDLSSYEKGKEILKKYDVEI